jgi:hypothetical protein
MLKKFNWENLPWVISRPSLQVIGLIQKDWMNGLIACLWHHLGYEPTKTK